MSNLMLHREQPAALIRPEPKMALTIRPATEWDLSFIDALMKKHSKAVAFASTTELLSHINEGTALIAVEGAANGVGGVPIGYCLYRDRYMKREDCGLVSQLVVDGDKRRGLAGAALVQAMFERVPWGVRLFCLWCAQDLEANRFWEALGFKALAVRAGSRGKADGGRRKDGTRVQIFWQRHVREGDDYSFWYPSQTTGGRMGEARLVLPIPPDKHWSDELPLVLPGMGGLGGNALPETDAAEAASAKTKRARKPKPAPAARPVPLSVSNGMRFGPATPPPTATATGGQADAAATKPDKPKRVRPRCKNDPKFIAAARELRDRYLEQVNSGLLLPTSVVGKYDVSRQIEAVPSAMKIEAVPALPMLDAA